MYVIHLFHFILLNPPQCGNPFKYPVDLAPGGRYRRPIIQDFITHAWFGRERLTGEAHTAEQFSSVALGIIPLHTLALIFVVVRPLVCPGNMSALINENIPSYIV